MLPRLPSRISRAGVLLSFGATVALTLAFIYERRIAGAPLRLGRDGDGAFRWLTKRDLLLMRVQELEHALKESPDNTRLQRRLKATQSALAQETEALRASGELTPEDEAREAALLAGDTDDDDALTLR